MHTHLKSVFKWGVHFSALVKAHFNSATKLFQAAINTVSLNALPPVRHTQF